MNSYLVIQVYLNRIVWEIFGYGLYNIMVFCQHRSEFVIFLLDKIMATMFLVSYLFSFHQLGFEGWRCSKYLKTSFSFHQLGFEERKTYKINFEEWELILYRFYISYIGFIFLVSYLFSFRRLGFETWRYSKYLKASFSFHQLRFEEQKFYKMIFEEWKIILCRLCMNVNGGIIPSRSFHIYDKWYFGFYDIFSLH